MLSLDKRDEEIYKEELECEESDVASLPSEEPLHVERMRQCLIHNRAEEAIEKMFVATLAAEARRGAVKTARKVQSMLHDSGGSQAPSHAEIMESDLRLEAGRTPAGEGSFRIITADDEGWYSREFMDANPTWLFTMGDMAAAVGHDMLDKNEMKVVEQLQLAKRSRKHVNSVGIPVVKFDGTAFVDADLKSYKPKLQRACRYISNRVTSHAIDTLVLPPRGNFAPYHDYEHRAPLIHNYMQTLLGNLHRKAEGYEPKAVRDSGENHWHGPSSERVLTESVGGGVKLSEGEELVSGSLLTNVLLASAKRARRDPHEAVERSSHMGAYAMLYDEKGNGIVACCDEGSVSEPADSTCYVDVRTCLKLGWKINSRDKRSIDVAGGGSHTTYGSVRLHLKFENYDPGYLTYQVIELPNSLSVLLGANEKRNCMIDTNWSKEFRTPHFQFGLKSSGQVLDFIKRPKYCPHKQLSGWKQLLAIEKAEVEAHRAKIEVESCNGATLAFTANAAEAELVASIESERQQELQSLREQAQLMHVASDDGGEWDIEFCLGVGEDGRREVAEADAELNRRSREGELEPEDAMMLLSREVSSYSDLSSDETSQETDACVYAVHRGAFEPELGLLPSHADAEVYAAVRKAVEQLPDLSDDEKNEFLRDCRDRGYLKPDRLTEDYGICPSFLHERLHKRTPEAEALWQELVAFFRRPGMCMMHEEMTSQRANHSEPVDIVPRPGHENVEYHHKSKVPAEVRDRVEKQLRGLIEKGVLRHCPKCRTVSRMLIVKKKGTKKVRIVCDMKTSNSHTVPVMTVMPSVEDVLNTVDPQAAIYSVFDLLAGFYSCSIRDNGSQEWTGMSTPLGILCWQQLVMGANLSVFSFQNAVGEALDRFGLNGSPTSKNEVRYDRQGEDQNQGATDVHRPAMSTIGKQMHEELSQGRWAYDSTEKHTKEMDYDFVVPFMDDALICARDLRGMHRRNWMFCTALSHENFHLNADKAFAYTTCVEFLGSCLCSVSNGTGPPSTRIYASPSRMADLLRLPPPKTRRAMLSSLASLGWFRLQSPGMVAISQELFKIASPNVDFKKEWRDDVHGRAWTELLESIARGVARVIPDRRKRKILITDACQKSEETGQGGLAAMFGQINDDGIIEVISFCSRALHGGETSASARHLERAAIIMGLDKNFEFIYGDDALFVECRSDHRNVLTTLSTAARTGTLSPKEQTELEFLSKFNIKLVYTQADAGCLRVADMLSRNIRTHASDYGLARGEGVGGQDKYGRPYGTGSLEHIIGRTHPYLAGEKPEDMMLNPPPKNWDPGPTTELEVWDGDEFAPTNDYIDPSTRKRATASVNAVGAGEQVTDCGCDGCAHAHTLPVAKSKVLEARRRIAAGVSTANEEEVLLSHAVSRGVYDDTVYGVVADVEEVQGNQSEAFAPGTVARYRLKGDPWMPNAKRYVQLEGEEARQVALKCKEGDQQGRGKGAHAQIVEEAIPALAGCLTDDMVDLEFTPSHYRDYNPEVDAVGKEEFEVLHGYVGKGEGKSALMLNETDDLAKVRRKFVYEGDEQLLLDIYDETKQRGDYKHLIPKLRIHRKHHSGVLMRKTLTSGGVWKWLIVVPEKARDEQRAIAELYHNYQGHINPHATYRLVREKYWWRNMSVTIPKDVEKCATCRRTKDATHRGFGMPQVSTPTAVPFAHIAIDKMHPPSADGGYDGILVVIDHATRFTILIPHKSTYTAKDNAQLLYKHVFSVFGIPESIRSDSERALIGDAFARLSEVMHIEQIVSSALNKTSNGMAERRIRFVNTLLKSVMEDKESRSWVEILPMIQSVANGYPHPASGITSEQALFGFQPRRPSDLIHANVQSLPEGMLRNSFETNQKLLDELRASMLDQHQAAAEEMAARMAVRYRDLPESWGKDERTWYVYLNTDAFTDNRFDKAGVRNKHYKSPGAGPYEVSQIFEDKIHFSLVLPEKMKNRYKNVFNVKSIKAFSDELEEPRDLLDSVVDDLNDAPLDAVNDSDVGMPGMPNDQHGVERLLERTYNPMKKYYEYLVKWTGYPIDDASWQSEGSLMENAAKAVSDYDLTHPRGANKADSKGARTRWVNEMKRKKAEQVEREAEERRRREQESAREARLRARSLSCIEKFEDGEALCNVLTMERSMRSLDYLLSTNTDMYEEKATEYYRSLPLEGYLSSPAA